MLILSGKEVGQALEERLAAEVQTLAGTGRVPGLAVILAGDNPVSATYVRSKLTKAEKLGIRSLDRHLPASISQSGLEAVVEELNRDPAVNGIICQLPLPEHLDAERITHLIDPMKDVDCFHPFNFGLLAQGAPRFIPCTPAGILVMLEHYDLPVSGRHVVVVGRSNIVGRPMALLLSAKGRDATVTVCHSRTAGLETYTRQADLLIVATGRAEWITGDMVREGAVIIDVGVNRVADASRPKGYRVAGDVHYASVAPRASAITPVPGGVGPMTVLMLMSNTLRALRLQLPLDIGMGMGIK
jgi:methylenetetrahydrofolate dehydrogenase (NADP+)/methenyltetrahydrofolate cyclohydrolase